MRQLHVVTDLQFGSTGKGLFCGYLAKQVKADTLISAWGPNAGHTFVEADGTKHVNIMVPSGIVAPSVRQVLIGPGSVIEPGRMLDEIMRYGIFNSDRVRLAIHEHAAVVHADHRKLEAGYGFGIGSTMKGVGEAVIEKIRRVPGGKIVARDALKGTPLEGFVVGVDEYNDCINESKVALLEGAQGFSLGINNGFYPYTTSRECATHQMLSDCAIPRACWQPGKSHDGTRLRHQTRVYGVARTYPIRVANRYASCAECSKWVVPGCSKCQHTGRGEQIGWSGPGYVDQKELQWSDIGREPELTTVTKLPRRLFTFSRQQVQQAIRMNGVDFVFLNFCNYARLPMLYEIINEIEKCGPDVCWLGWGEREDQVERVADSEFFQAAAAWAL